MQYEATWESLDRHRAPEWFHDAKFGMFVHYQPTRFSDSEYPEPVNYSAENWVKTAKRGGMKYIVPTAKHGDGHTDWPSEHASLGAETVGGPRDIITPLVETARKEGIKIGIYYCWDELRNSDYPDQRSYVMDTTLAERYRRIEEQGADYGAEFVERSHRRLREVIDLYHPDLLWFDGDYRFPPDFWRSPEIVAWYYNRMDALGKDVCVNDRVGARYLDTRELEYSRRDDGSDVTEDPHGDFWTPELTVVDGIMDHKWETNMTIQPGWSWPPSGDWRDPEDLLRLLIDVVSKNGNLLLNVGPKPDGTIPEEEKAILREMGDWLAVNGEAIYGTRPLGPPDPDAGYLSLEGWREEGEDMGYETSWDVLVEYLKESGPLWFTRRGHVAYAIYDGWPGESLRLEEVPVRQGAEIEMLGIDQPLEWTTDGDELVVQTPASRPCEHACVFRIPMPLRT